MTTLTLSSVQLVEQSLLLERQAQLGEVLTDPDRCGLVVELGERRSPELLTCGIEVAGRLVGPPLEYRLPPGVNRRFGPVDVNGHRPAEPVRAVARSDAVRAHDAADAVHVSLHRLACRGRWMSAPQGVDQRIDRDVMTSGGDESCEHDALLRPERDHVAAAVQHQQRSEDPHLHGREW